MKIGDRVRLKPPWEHQTGEIIQTRTIHTIRLDVKDPFGHKSYVADETELELVPEEKEG